MPADSRIEVRSFRAVFDLERRIYRVDRLRLNPSGVPLRGVAYLVAAELAVAVGARVAVLGWPLAALPWLARYVVLPGAVAALLTLVRVDGRPFHSAARSLTRLVTHPRTLARLRPCVRHGQRWRPPELIVIPDGSEPQPRRFRYRGPGAVLVLREHERVEGRSVGRWPGRIAVELRTPVRARPLARGRVFDIGPGVMLAVGERGARRSVRDSRTAAWASRRP